MLNVVVQRDERMQREVIHLERLLLGDGDMVARHQRQQRLGLLRRGSQGLTQETEHKE